MRGGWPSACCHCWVGSWGKEELCRPSEAPFTGLHAPWRRAGARGRPEQQRRGGCLPSPSAFSGSCGELPDLPGSGCRPAGACSLPFLGVTLSAACSAGPRAPGRHMERRNRHVAPRHPNWQRLPMPYCHPPEPGSPSASHPELVTLRSQHPEILIGQGEPGGLGKGSVTSTNQ